MTSDPTTNLSTIDPSAVNLEHELRAGTATFAVVGLGYTGLPVARSLAFRGSSVVGIDVDDKKVNALSEHHSYIPDVTDEQLLEVSPRFWATTDVRAVERADVVMVCVPTPLTADGQADLTMVRAALAHIAPYLRLGATVILQSTVPPGTTDEEAGHLARATGRTLGVDLFVAFCPERVDPANAAGWDVSNTTRVVSGVTSQCLRRASAVIEYLCGGAHTVSSPIVAELAKLLENSSRLVNISFANEFADVCRDLSVSVREVIAAAATKPFGFQPYYPGPGVGGECIPVDPVFLLRSQRRAVVPMPLMEMAYRLALDRPATVVDRIGQALAGRGGTLLGARILILGVAYKPNVDDVRNAPAWRIIRSLQEQDVEVEYHDPFVPSLFIGGRTLRSVSLAPLEFDAYDCVVLVTNHDAFTSIEDWSAAPLVIDSHGVLSRDANVVAV
jgi:UDP-N-acetyl-D-glucosamine dehydrogenase